MESIKRAFDCVEVYYIEHGICKTAYRPRVWCAAYNQMVELEIYFPTKNEAFQYAKKWNN